jgi:signal transduction histidine kinase
MTSSNDPSSLLESEIPNLIKKWEKVARKKIPSGAALGHKDLINSFPEFLKSLADSLAVSRHSAQWKNVEKTIGLLAERHGNQRAEQSGYTLDQVIAEHQILRRILFHFFETRNFLDPEQWDTLLECVDVGISEAASAFALKKGFKDARYLKMEIEKNRAQNERNSARSQIVELEVEKAMREQFVSTLSHDLRTPITSAKLAAELIAHNAKDSEKISKLAVRITDDLSRADRMIRDLLDANRIRSGETLPLNVQKTGLLRLIGKTIAGLARVYGDRFHLHADHEIVGHWSGSDLERAIENLAINAVKYGAHDTPIDLRVYEEGERVCISLHNFGSYITPAQQQALFQPFTRLAGRGKKGWGLGLALVRGIAEAHGGQVQIDSAIDTGTTFTLLLPKDARSIEDQGAEQAHAS